MASSPNTKYQKFSIYPTQNLKIGEQAEKILGFKPIVACMLSSFPAQTIGLLEEIERLSFIKQ